MVKDIAVPIAPNSTMVMKLFLFLPGTFVDSSMPKIIRIYKKKKKKKKKSQTNSSKKYRLYVCAASARMYMFQKRKRSHFCGSASLIMSSHHQSP
ncbi:hypothetical protein HanIR_Chr04g0171491 [Helianthus annuus]|nr:hypothetical protein HanIR_Chr04g0171491 [Helianthus annuus]